MDFDAQANYFKDLLKLRFHLLKHAQGSVGYKRLRVQGRISTRVAQEAFRGLGTFIVDESKRPAAWVMRIADFQKFVDFCNFQVSLLLARLPLRAHFLACNCARFIDGNDMIRLCAETSVRGGGAGVGQLPPVSKWPMALLVCRQELRGQTDSDRQRRAVGRQNPARHHASFPRSPGSPTPFLPTAMSVEFKFSVSSHFRPSPCANARN